MLKRLYIKNLALIEECELELNKGLNIITGETGAGKSLVLGSLGLLLGNKADKGMIRSGCKEAYVEAVFDLSDRQKRELELKSSLEFEDKVLIVSRKLSLDRNYARINNESVTNKILNLVVGSLIDICGQRDNMILLNKDSHLRLLDSYAFLELNKELRDVASAFKQYKTYYLGMSDFNLNEEERLKKLDYLQFVYHEIEGAELEIGEDDRLEADFKRMNHALNINEALNYANESAKNIDFSKILACLNKVRSYDPKIDSLYSRAMDMEAELSDFISEIDSYIEDFSFSQENFKSVGDRLDLINNLKFKYGKTLEDIFHFRDETQREIEELNQYEEKKRKLELKLLEAKKQLDESCLILSQKRQEIAKVFCRKIKEILLDLEFHYVEIQASFEKTDGYTPSGFDKMGLLVSLNKGEEVKPLETVASGGELSRIMLAIKSLYSGDLDERILIFDEIDTGIGGKTALSIAHRMEALARNRQLISITHLASIAAAADHHYKIYKKETKDRTNTYIDVLDEEQSIIEVARMIGGDETSRIAIDNAKELKKQLKNERV